MLNQLLETLAATGHLICATDDGPAYVFILDVKLTFRVKERGHQESVPLTREQQAENKRAGFDKHRPGSVFHPTGELEISAFKVGSSYATASTADTRTLSVEKKIQAFVGRRRHMVIRDAVDAEMAAERRAVAAAEQAERERLREIQRVALDHLKRVEEWASKLERANRLRALAAEFESKELTASDGVVDAVWIGRAADWLDPTVECRWDDVDNAPPRYGEL